MCEGLSAFWIVFMVAIASSIYLLFLFCVYMWMVVYVLASMDICVETSGVTWVMILESPVFGDRVSH